MHLNMLSLKILHLEVRLSEAEGYNYNYSFNIKYFLSNCCAPIVGAKNVYNRLLSMKELCS